MIFLHNKTLSKIVTPPYIFPYHMKNHSIFEDIFFILPSFMTILKKAFVSVSPDSLWERSGWEEEPGPVPHPPLGWWDLPSTSSPP